MRLKVTFARYEIKTDNAAFIIKDHLSDVTGFMVSLQIARKTKKASLIKRSLVES